MPSRHTQSHIRRGSPGCDPTPAVSLGLSATCGGRVREPHGCLVGFMVEWPSVEARGSWLGAEAWKPILVTKEKGIAEDDSHLQHNNGGAKGANQVLYILQNHTTKSQIMRARFGTPSKEELANK
eukprot:1176121-Prorocentrum_minimum.AAC.2